MDKNEQNELELNAIHSLARAFDGSFNTNINLYQALEDVGHLFQDEDVALTFVHYDSFNDDYYCKTYHPSKNTPFTAHFKEDDRPRLLKKLQLNQGPSSVDASEWMDSFNVELPSDAQTFRCTPFFERDDIHGLITHSNSRKIDIGKQFPALIQSIKTFFDHEYDRLENLSKINAYQTVMDLMPQRVFWKNRDSVYMGCNQAFADDASVESTFYISGKTDHDIFPEQAVLYRSDDARAMETRTHMINSEEPQTHQNGNTIWLRTSKRPILSGDNNVIGIVGTYDDITELKVIQKELQEAKSHLEVRVKERTVDLENSNSQLETVISELKSAQNQLVESEKMAALGQLVAGIAHEINTPIGIAVTGASNLEFSAKELLDQISGGKLTKTDFTRGCETMVESSNIILRNLERASSLVRNFKMIAVDQSSDDKRSIDVFRYLEDVVSTMTPKTSKKNVKIFLKGDHDITVETYPGAIAQIVTNLIDNALNHAFDLKSQGTVAIQLESEHQNWRLTVSDDGRGINSESIEKIFEPFYTTKRGSGGSGLGLSIIYNLVTQRLKGDIRCESVMGKGTAFSIVLPMALNDSANF